MLYTQNYAPLPFAPLSVLIASAPVLILFYLLVIRRAPASVAAICGALAAFLIAISLYKMPIEKASMSFVNGALFGLFPICWTVACAMFLYNMTVATGRFEQIKNSVAGLSSDHRLQAVLIAFSFGAFLEGAAGGGAPVAICAAMLVGLGFQPFMAACICLIANTSPVAYGGFGTPILTLQSVTNLDVQKLSAMAGNQLPFLSCLIPFWMVRCLCGWKETFQALPAIAVAGGSFAISQYFFAHSPAFPLTDIAGGLISLVVTALFLRFWSPKKIWRMKPEKGGNPQERSESEAWADAGEEAETETFVERMALGKMLHAWAPFLLLCVLMASVGMNKKTLDELHFGPLKTYYELHLPTLDKLVQRLPPVVEKPTLEAVIFKFNWLTMPGTSIFFTILLAIPLLKISRAQLHGVCKTTLRQMAIPVPTIVFMLGLAYITRLAGLDATMGMAFKNTGVLYPFFAAILGWLGVFLTGTDAGSNALFGSLQKISAQQLGLNPILICVANSTGGVMGKMIDAQSICVATAATDRVGSEAKIFKWVVWHSLALACIVGLIVLLQAYVSPFTKMVP